MNPDIKALTDAIAMLVRSRAQSGPDSVYAPGSAVPYIEPGPRDWYSYSTGRQTLAAGAQASGSIGIEADSNFYLNAITYQADVAGAAIAESTNPIPLVTLLLVDSGSSRQLMNAAQPIGSIAGDGKRPYRLPKPRLFRRTTSINWTLVSYAAASISVNVVLHGFKVYPISGN